ncbi:SCO family protein [Limobrevibacterium gyesilva]|uniref:SCO family protein n=1 Tax=Limobrevibacterium gyesilva TaxID=2991712 RepID=A0AA41YPM5_9PROT|nr:SCO family protein [Limobrevibacterium gyesilva]MCW3474190.1 SCO family protein [Limobrevibacterium gyesilva]
MLRYIRWSAYTLIVVILVAWAAIWRYPNLLGGTVQTAISGVAGLAVPAGVSVGGPFALTDTNGHAVTDASYRGRWMLVYFGYTFCPDVCPTELQAVAAALDKLGPDAAKIAPLFITVDPERDTVAALADYVKLFDERLIGLTGTPDQISAAARAYRVYYAKATPKDSSSYLMDHSSFLYLMGPDGTFRALFRQGTSPQDLADGIRARMAAS